MNVSIAHVYIHTYIHTYIYIFFFSHGAFRGSKSAGTQPVFGVHQLRRWKRKKYMYVYIYMYMWAA